MCKNCDNCKKTKGLRLVEIGRLDALLDEVASYLTDENITPCEEVERFADQLGEAAMLIRDQARESQNPPTPGPLAERDKANFETLRKACDDGNLALVPATRKSDGKQVSLVCAMGWDGENYRPAPVAVMVEGNPYELFHDPTVV